MSYSQGVKGHPAPPSILEHTVRSAETRPSSVTEDGVERNNKTEKETSESDWGGRREREEETVCTFSFLKKKKEKNLFIPMLCLKTAALNEEK